MPDFLFAPIRLLMQYPYLGLVPALLFGFAYRSLRPRAPGVLLWAAGLWVLFAAYETYMFFWSKTVVAPIRVDLLLITPVLYFMTAAGLLSWWTHARRPPHP